MLAIVVMAAPWWRQHGGPDRIGFR